MACIEVDHGAEDLDGAGGGQDRRHELRAAQLESYLDLARSISSTRVLTISNQLVTTPGRASGHAARGQGRQAAGLHHLSWSQIRTEALMEQANKSVSDPDQAWILAEFIRYLETPAVRRARLRRHGTFLGAGPRGSPHRDPAPAGQGRRGRRRQVRAPHLLRRHAAVPRSSAGSSGPWWPPPSCVTRPGACRRQPTISLAERARCTAPLRVPDTVAPIKVTADLRAGLIRCAITVPAPRTGHGPPRG